MGHDWVMTGSWLAENANKWDMDGAHSHSQNNFETDVSANYSDITG